MTSQEKTGKLLCSASRVVTSAQVCLLVLLFMGLVGVAGCSDIGAWRNSRAIYLRNQTATAMLLTWKIPCAHFQPVGPWSPGAGLMEPGGLPPTVTYSSSDTLLDNNRQTLPLHSHLITGDSISLTVSIAADTTYLISSYEESFHHSDPDEHLVGGFTFLPCTVQWLSINGHLQHQLIYPLRWRQEQDQEANKKLNNSYNLVRYIDYK